MKRIRMIGAIVALGVLGTAGMALGVVKHTGQNVLDCTGANTSYKDFANAYNTVNEKVVIDGATAYNAPFSFQGSSGGHHITLTGLNGFHVVTISASWNTNGHQGSSGPTVVNSNCDTQTVTTTRTVTSPTQTVTGPTTTVQLPAPPAVTVTNNVTTTLSTSSIQPPVTVTVKSKPKVVFKTKVVYKNKATICKKVVKVPLPKILKPTK